MDNYIWWIAFNLLILILLYLDLKVFNKEDKIVSVKEASLWALFWFSLAMCFNLFIYFQFGKQSATEFFTGYILELSLSVDNLFVFVLIFEFFETDPRHQHRVLFWGILGAIVMRAIMIVLGTTLLAKFAWIEFFFGGFLIFSAFKMLGDDDRSDNLEENIIVKFLHKYFPVSAEYHGENFIIIENGKRIITPLLVVLILIEVSDLVFAVDSIPAVIGITKNPFIVYTSNIFAVLGLRNLYFLLSNVIDKFHYLKYGLAIILAFIGTKMLLPIFNIHISNEISLAVIALMLFGSVLASLIIKKNHK